MRSNFKSPLKVEDGVVKAVGRLEWEDGETYALVSVSISQKGQKVAGMATTPDQFEKPKRNWSLDIEPGYTNGYRRKFRAGPADAVGIVCAMGDDVRVFFWSQQVQLEKA